MMRQPNQGAAIAGYAARRVKLAAVGTASADNAADAEDNASAEDAAAAIIDKF